MSQENVEIVRRFFERWNETQDLERSTEVWHPEIEFEISSQLGRDSPDHRVAHGIEEARGFASDFITPFDSWRWEVEDVIEAGENVVVLLEGLGFVGDSPPVSTSRFAYVITLRDGKLIRIQDFPRPAEGLEAAGLSE